MEFHGLGYHQLKNKSSSDCVFGPFYRGILSKVGLMDERNSGIWRGWGDGPPDVAVPSSSFTSEAAALPPFSVRARELLCRRILSV